MDTELAAACTLLQAEFPDVSRATLESALREVDLDIPAARRKLLELAEKRGQAEPSSRGPLTSQAAESPSSPGGWFSSSSWNQGMRDLGLESLGAQLSLLGKQVASSLNAVLPADLNPFAFDEDDYDEEELAAAAAVKAKMDEREKNSAALAAGAARKLQSRRGGGRTSDSRFGGDEGEGDEGEDTDKLN